MSPLRLVERELAKAKEREIIAKKGEHLPKDLMSNDTFIHLCAGGVGGTMGAVITCPLEVVKTRLQSSAVLYRRHVQMNATHWRPSSVCYTPEMHWNLFYHQHCPLNSRIIILQDTLLPWTHKRGLLSCFRHLIEQEGCRALFKGLGANVIGVAPTRAIYFCTYSTAKKKFNQIFTPDSHSVHVCSAGTAGFVACTLTNPIWFVKTRLQLDRNKITAGQCVAQVFREKGILGFYKGISASYFGISETIINFALYEWLKADLKRIRQRAREANGEHLASESDNEAVDFMIAGAISKTVACCLAYPHEVARTRLRESNSRYHGFFQTLATVCREEGYRGLYRGLGTQLIRQIPNMAIMMTTYEATVYLLNSCWGAGEPKIVQPLASTESLLDNDDQSHGGGSHH